MSELKKNTPPSLGMRKLTYALALLMIVLLAFIGLRLFAKTTEISVVGNTTYTREEIIQASGITVGKRLYGIDDNRIEAQLLASYPLLQSVQILKNGFYGVTIEVTEKEPVYYLEDEVLRYTLSEDLCVLSKAPPDGSAPPALIHLTLPEYPELSVGATLTLLNDNTDYILRFLNNLKATSYFEDLTAINFQKKHSIKASYQNSTELWYGSGENFAEKSRLIEQYLQTLTPSLYVKFDVSDPNSAFAQKK